MIILLGGSGYIGQAFQRALEERRAAYLSLSRTDLDYTRYELLSDFLRKTGCDFLINAAGFTGKPNVDVCETARTETLQGNTLLPLSIAHACAALSIPWAHISSGCIFRGAKIVQNGTVHIEKDLTTPRLRELCEMNSPVVQGFTENDEPNFTFQHPPCSFYSGTKALAEKAIMDVGQQYIWRLRIPFDEFDNPRNYLSKLQSYPKVYDNVNSLSHLGDAVRACLELWGRRAPFGIYNVTNPGFVTARGVIRMIQKTLCSHRKFEFWANDEEFYQLAAKAARSNCVLDTSKLLSTGVTMRPVEDALEEALRNWKPRL